MGGRPWLNDLASTSLQTPLPSSDSLGTMPTSVSCSELIVFPGAQAGTKHNITAVVPDTQGSQTTVIRKLAQSFSKKRERGNFRGIENHIEKCNHDLSINSR